MRSHACDIFDLLRKSYEGRVNFLECAEQIAKEATQIVLAVWDQTGAVIKAETWRNTVSSAIVQHLGWPLKVGPIQKALIAPVTLAPEDYAAIGVDIASGPPLLQMIAKAAPSTQPQVFAPVPSQTVAPQPAKISRSVTAPSAARKLERFISASGLTLTQFAGKAEADERTIRRFRRTGTVDKTVLARIAGVMNTSVEKLLE